MAPTASAQELAEFNQAPATETTYTQRFYAREDFAMSQSVYRAQTIERLFGVSVARIFLLCIGADSSLIERVVSPSSSSKRRR